MRRLVAIWLAVLFSTASCGAGPGEAARTAGGADRVTAPAPVGQARPELSSTFGADSATVSVTTANTGPLAVTVGPIQVPPRGTTAWVQHDLSITNTSDAAVYLNDLRYGALLGDPHRLLAGDSLGCGYGTSADGAPATPDCAASYVPVEVRPHQAHIFQIYLWRDLPGLAPLQAGSYRFDKPIHYRLDRPFNDPGEAGTTATVTLTYIVAEPASTTTRGA